MNLPTNKVTIDRILSKIKKTDYTLLPDGRTTICTLYMENGFTIRGESACVDPKEYNQFLGEKYAREQAINNVWPFEGYLLAQELWLARSA